MATSSLHTNHPQSSIQNTAHSVKSEPSPSPSLTEFDRRRESMYVGDHGVGAQMSGPPPPAPSPLVHHVPPEHTAHLRVRVLARDERR